MTMPLRQFRRGDDDTEVAVSETTTENRSMPPTKPFDESKLTPAQRKALEIARAQGKRPMTILEAVKLDIEPDELAKFADALDEQRRESRSRPSRDRFK